VATPWGRRRRRHPCDPLWIVNCVDMPACVVCSEGRVESRKFASGDYTLAFDNDPEIKQPGLDVNFCVLPPKTKWNNSYGGTIHYMNEGEEEELLTVEPMENTLSIVFRGDAGVIRFVKYVNCEAPCPRYDLSAVYHVVDEDEDSVDSTGSTDEEDEDEDEDSDEPMEQVPKKSARNKQATEAVQSRSAAEQRKKEKEREKKKKKKEDMKRENEELKKRLAELEAKMMSKD